MMMVVVIVVAPFFVVIDVTGGRNKLSGLARLLEQLAGELGRLGWKLGRM
jgi:hypothetical protein